MENQVIGDMVYSKLWGNESNESATDILSRLERYDTYDAPLDISRHPDSEPYIDVSSHTSIPYVVVNMEGLTQLWQQKRAHHVRHASWNKRFHGVTNRDYETSTRVICAGYLSDNILPSNWRRLADASNYFVVDPAPSNERYSFDGINEHIDHLAIFSTDADYEPGMDNEHSIQFEAAIKKYGEDFLKTFLSRQSSFSINARLSFIETLGRLQHEDTNAFRIWMLNRYLASNNAIIRDTASIAIADLAGTKSISFLSKAIEAEQNPSLKCDMQILLSDLQEEL